MYVPVWLSVGYAVSPAGRHQTKHLCVCVCVICTFYEVDPYAAMRWQVYSAQSAVASLRL